MNELVAKNPDKEIHVVLDNLNTHKPKQDRWLKAHPRVHFHFIPTHSSWLNQVECWFSILSRGALQGASFTQRQNVDRGDRNLYRQLESARHPLRVDKRGSPPAANETYYSHLCN
jgi:transposase